MEERAYLNLYVWGSIMVTKIERISNIQSKNFDSNASRDGMKEGKTFKTVIRIKFYHKQKIAEKIAEEIS